MANSPATVKQRDLEANYKAASRAGFAYAQVIKKQNGDTIYNASNAPITDQEVDKQSQDQLARLMNG